jgi:hypothetical protein
MRLIVKASERWFASAGDSVQRIAEEIIARNAGSIRQFSLAQTQEYRAGVGGVHTTHLRLQEVDLDFQMVQGSSILTVTVKPENTPSAPLERREINQDGYFIWVHTDASFPGIISVGGHVFASINGPYDLYLNGYLIVRDFMPDRQSIGFVVMFGNTALRCPSLQDPPDAAKELNPLVKTLGLVNKIFPALPQIPDGRSADGQFDVPKHNNLPGYYLFNWEDIRNPAQYVAAFGSLTSWDDFFVNAIPFPPKPDFTQGIQFAASNNSPLNLTGPNYFSVYPSATNKRGSEHLNVETLFAEFYNPDVLRKVRQSWTKTPDGRQDIVVNDRPIEWEFTSPQSGGPGTFNFPTLAMDLSPPKDRDTSQIVSPLDTADGATAKGGTGITDAQRAANAAYRLQVTSIITAFNLIHAPLIEAARVTFQAAFDAYGVATSALRDYALAQGFGLLDPNGISLIPQIIETPIVHGDKVYEAAILAAENLVGLPIVRTTTISLIDACAALGQPLIDALAAYLAEQGKQPTLPDRPTTTGLSIDKFVYRKITISNGVWTFGNWLNKPN